MAEHAKAEWAAAPESVRGEVHRMQQEFDEAYHKYRGDHETMNTIRHFHDMAREHGTTLDRALEQLRRHGATSCATTWSAAST